MRKSVLKTLFSALFATILCENEYFFAYLKMTMLELTRAKPSYENF